MRAKPTTTGESLRLFEEAARCNECGEPVDEGGTVFDSGWARCSSCKARWAARQHLLKGEQAHALVAVTEVRCRDCGRVIVAEGPLRVLVRETGEIGSGLCGVCVRMFAAARSAQMLREEIVRRVGFSKSGRSRGMLTRELLREGWRLVDVRTAFDVLLDDGEIVNEKGMVKVP